MTSNKGIAEAFCIVLGIYRELQKPVHLTLKGLSSSYGSHELIQKASKTALQIMNASKDEVDYLRRHITYIGQDMSHADMQTLYSDADAYISPYRSEGFNLPVLEAMGHGLPVLVTAGGACDDFLPPGYPMAIPARIQAYGNDGSAELSCNIPSGIRLLKTLIEDTQLYDNCAKQCWQAAKLLTWENVTSELLSKIATATGASPLPPARLSL
jgi:glycosyltransferase involved in cell wall biosynthesis